MMGCFTPVSTTLQVATVRAASSLVCQVQLDVRRQSMSGKSIRLFAILHDFVGHGCRERATSSAMLFVWTIGLASCGGGTGVSGGSGGGSIEAATASVTVTPGTILTGENGTRAWAS